MKKIIYGILAILLVIVVGFIFLSVYKGSESSGNQKPKTEIIVNVKSLEKVSELVLLNASIQKVKSIENNTKLFGSNFVIFEVIGVELDKDKPYTLYDTSGGILSYSTKDIDTGEAVAEGFSNKNSIEATPFSSSKSSIDPKGKQSVSISEFVAVNPGQKVKESDEKAKDANYYKHKMKSGENIGWTANIQNGNYDTMNSFSINFNY